MNIFCYYYFELCIMLLIDIERQFIEKAIEVKRELVNMYKNHFEKSTGKGGVGEVLYDGMQSF